MITLNPLRWGKQYKSLEFQDVFHFDTGESIAKIGQVNGGMVQMDMRKADNARKVLREIPTQELIARCKKAAHMFEHETLPVGDSQQTVADFIHQQSASTGLPEHMCRNNMQKNCFVLSNIDKILDALTRGLDL
ncbi:MAG: aldehyde dehydrogenase, partial [Pirellula sp.]